MKVPVILKAQEAKPSMILAARKSGMAFFVKYKQVRVSDERLQKVLIPPTTGNQHSKTVISSTDKSQFHPKNIRSLRASSFIPIKISAGTNKFFLKPLCGFHLETPYRNYVKSSLKK
jgi:hypothetical protein